jgi:hypothetical protein
MTSSRRRCLMPDPLLAQLAEAIADKMSETWFEPPTAEALLDSEVPNALLPFIVAARNEGYDEGWQDAMRQSNPPEVGPTFGGLHDG